MPTTPLIALDAAVIDTETTGLDPAKARIVEIAAVRLVAGRIEPERNFRRLVRPDVPIPPAASAVHQIDDAMVADAPPFREVWPQAVDFLGSGALIGHSLGFDLAVIKRECERAGLPFRAAASLDTQLLAQVAAPNLAGYSLEQLATGSTSMSWSRHSALGDAMTTARIFAALVPRLRERGIRTLGEATQACRALTDALDRQHQAGWLEAAELERLAEGASALGSVDSYPYRHRVRDVMRAPPRFIAPDATVTEALARLMEERISSLYVDGDASGKGGALAADTGIITERDLLRAVARQGAAALGLPVRAVRKPAARGGPGRRVRLSRDRTHEPAPCPPSRRDRRGRARDRGGLGARPAAAAGRRGGLARRRDRCGDRRPCARRRLVQAAAGRGVAGGRRRAGARGRRGDLAGARRAHPPGRGDRAGAHARAWPWRTAVPLCGRGAGVGRTRREPAGDGPGQRAGLRRWRA